LANYFDVLVVDAPCSGSGMFRKDPAAIDEWSEEAVKLCSQRQQRILADVYPAIKRDGVLIYSTCSYSEAENEEIADWLCQEFALETIRLNIDPSWGIVETTSRQDQNWGYRFYPQHLKGEGFYLSCFRKKDGEVHSDFKNRKQEPIKIPIQHLQEMENWIASASLEIKLFQDTYYAIPAGPAHDLAFLQERLYLKKSGTRLGKFAGKDFIPDQELALSIWASPKIKRLNLNRAAAISYLKKEDLHITSDLSGWVLMCYEGFGLGWAKVLPKRINNYYPKEWRIINQAIK
jgi:NOL1/NOP2/fmu family ribosome biogenesis protein